MKPSLQMKKPGGLWLIAVVSLGLSILWADPGWGASGLSLKLYTLQEIHKFPMNQPVPAIGVMKNETKWSLNVDLGFSQMEIERYLIARDPQGVRHTPPFQETQASDMPPTSRWGDRETVDAEVLPPGWERSVTIGDLRKLFPVMNILSGWYTIEAEITVSRYGWTFKEPRSERLLGVLDNKAWHGTLKSNKLRIFMAPSRGGRMKLRVEDLSTPEQTARSNVEIRVFNSSEVLQKDSLADAWETLDSITRGNTGLGGWVTLPAGGSCLPEPGQGDAYVAIAQYKGEYKEAYFEQGAVGWQTECGGLLTRYILFGEPPRQFSLFGLDSTQLRNKVRVESGDVGAQSVCESCLSPGFEVSIEENVWISDGLEVKGNRVKIRSTASVYEVTCNELQNSGTIRMEDGVHTPCDLPVWGTVVDHFPPDSAFNQAGGDPVIVSPSDPPMILPSGGYGDLNLESNATLKLSGGTYYLTNLALGSDSKIVCEAPSTILIKYQLLPGTKAFIGPQAGSGFNAKDVVIFVAAGDGLKKKGKGKKTESLQPEAAVIGEGNTIKANIYVKNGTLLIGEGCVLEGSFIANDLVVGMKSVVNFDGAF